MSSLSPWLTPERIQYLHAVNDWQEAIRHVAAPLEKEGVISADYVANIFRQTQTLGPYFVIAPRIAMPHARPEEGANALGLSILRLAQGVDFDSPGHDPVDLVVMFSAPDNSSHVEMIAQLAEFLSDDERLDTLLNARDRNELLHSLIGH